jgi:2-polyprenyl-3-methyl-5-hydroxy-6-metoxy-1,4-benzoquinol methylase
MGSERATEAAPTQSLTAIPCNACGGRRFRPLFRKRGYDLVRCAGCRLVFVINPPSASEIAALYAVEAGYHEALHDPRHPGYARMTGIARQHLRMLRRSVPVPTGHRLLDIGCSSGLFLAEARAAGFEVQGAELSAASADFARSHFGLAVHAGDWRDAGYVDASFDVITLFDVIEHLPDPLGELRAIRRLLKPGGLLLQSTPDIDGLYPRLSYLLARPLDYWQHPEPPHHLYQFSRETLTAMARQAGFEVTRADQTRIGLDYSFGTPASWKISPKLLAYAVLFAPAAIVGPWIGMGDWLYLAARRAA